MSLPHRIFLFIPVFSLALAGCERLGIEDPAKLAAAREAEGKAVGAACRHAGRGLEDCYARNPKAQKAAIFAGWKDMNDYMAQNKIEVVPPASAVQETPAAESEKQETKHKAGQA